MNDEYRKLREFAEFIADESREHDVDGCDIQDKLIELDLVELRHIDQDVSIDGETEHYFLRWV